MIRFAFTTAEEREEIRSNINSAKTLKANRCSAKTFKEYLSAVGENDEFESLNEEELDNVLGRFWMDLRSADGDLYKSSSMEAARHGLNRYLKNPPHNKKFDIIKDSRFSSSNASFKAVLMELKRKAKGDVDHYPIITDNEIRQLYSSIHMDTSTPQGLYNKVQFDIRLYFCRRGNENMHSMVKDTFVVDREERTGARLAKKALGELTKNHRLDKENSSGVMPENPGSENCPVVSFEKYLSKLHPDSNRLWQRPKDSFLSEDTVWYCNTPVGEKKLKQFMSGLSKAVGLAKLYTNHSIRATGVTILSKSMFGAAQVMSVTGHKSVQSLSVYQRVGDFEKVQMGQAIANTVSPNEGILSLSDLGQSNELAGINCEELFADFDALPGPAQQAVPINNTFNNCKITWINSVTIQT